MFVLTARDAGESRISGHEKVGYLVEPFGIDEFAAPVRASLRRYTRQIGLAYSHGDRCARLRGKRRLEGSRLCSRREFDLQHALIEEPKRVLTRSEARERVDGSGEACGSDEVETYVHGLQSKIGAEQTVTVRGVGYRLR
ncbi:hypothetical protein BZM27_51350 [Paraburkholderia steynii]|uniref:OmpR/PhoB-type domain-containing protein n=1 Tax=Paraburkholderia steynii TaxID=1245441 RepID=A0A4R0XAY0_9BURK|nr:hypothetical protein BZM27_51350 [Paraburkholderia steynii]